MAIITEKSKMADWLAAHIGQEVTVDLGDHENNFDDKTLKLSAKVDGKLEYNDTESKSGYFVRIKDGYWGTSGITFPLRLIKEVETMPSGRPLISL